MISPNEQTTKRSHVAARWLLSAVLLSRIRRSPNDRRQGGGNECGWRPPIGTRAHELLRVSIVTQRRPTGGRTKAAAAGSVVGGGALRVVVLSGGRGCIKRLKVPFFLVSSRRSPEPAPAQMGFVAAVA